MEDYFLNSGSSGISMSICISISISISIGICSCIGIRGSETFVSVRVLV